LPEQALDLQVDGRQLDKIIWNQTVWNANI